MTVIELIVRLRSCNNDAEVSFVDFDSPDYPDKKSIISFALISGTDVWLTNEKE